MYHHPPLLNKRKGGLCQVPLSPKSFAIFIDFYRIGLGAIIVLNSSTRLLSLIVHASLSLELAL
jgi:hypothetical protein